jgi:ATP/maltotriose-dependent transcriptional regulator MalT/DNA-binding SARP family transcriptional activator
MHVLIARPFLSERLNRALDQGSLVLVAGAGYGKTVALDEALAARSVASAWIRCSDSDRDPGHLVRRIVAAVQATAPGSVDVLAEQLAAAQQQVDAQGVTRELVAELERLLVDPLILVIDDAENLQPSPEAAAIVGSLLAADSPTLRVAVATRRPLPVKLAKLRSAGRLTQLGPDDLQFSTSDCEQLLTARSGRQPTLREVERLFDATEGWPLGASLGALHSDRLGLEGTSRARLFDFLEEEVLDELPAELRDGVIECAVPRQLNRDCLRALRLPDRFPEMVARAGLALRALESEPGWVAYHPLVRECLLERFESERTPQARRDVHACLGAALSAAGRAEDAIEHWLAAHAWPDATRAISTVGAGLLHTAPATVRRWLEALPADARAEPSCLLLQGTLEWEDARFHESVESLRAAHAGFAGKRDLIGEWLSRFALVEPLWVMSGYEEIIALADGFDDDPALDAGLIPPVVAAYAAAALGAVGRVAECAALSQRLLAHPHLGPLRPVRTIWEVEMRLLAGCLDELVSGAHEALREFERFDPVNRLSLMLQILATALAHQGRDAESLAEFERSEKAARQVHLDYGVRTTHYWRSLLHARAGRREAAEHHHARALAISRGSGWREYLLDAAQAMIAALRGDVGEAVAAADAALALVQAAPLSDRFFAAVELAPILFEAGLPSRAQALVDDHLALCEERVPGQAGSYARALLLGVRAWLHDAVGDERGALEDLGRMWTAAGADVADVLRREWRLLEQLLWKALERGILNPSPAIAAIEASSPGGEALVPFTRHPDARIRHAALAPAAASGAPSLMSRLVELEDDTDLGVRTAARAAAARLRTNPPALSFTLFGGFELRRGSWRVDDAAWDRRVAQRVVRYLLVHRGSAVPDDALLEAFWADTSPDSARRSLRVAVSCARAVLDVPGAPSAIEVAERTLALRLRERDSVDVDRFQWAAADALAARGSERRQLLERAAALWTGEPLPEERYAEWAIPWREILKLRYAELLGALVRACRADEDHLAGAHAARRLVELDPLDEDAHRELMISYARSGRRAYALRQFLECRRTLVDQLGVEPASDTIELQQRVLAGEPV